MPKFSFKSLKAQGRLDKERARRIENRRAQEHRQKLTEVKFEQIKLEQEVNKQLNEHAKILLSKKIVGQMGKVMRQDRADMDAIGLTFEECAKFAMRPTPPRISPAPKITAAETEALERGKVLTPKPPIRNPKICAQCSSEWPRSTQFGG